MDCVFCYKGGNDLMNIDIKNEELSPIRRLLDWMGKKRGMSIVFAAMLAVLSTALGLVPYLVVYVIAEKVLGSGEGWLEQQSYIALGTVALLAILGKGWLFALSTRMAHLVAFPVLYDIRILLAKKLATLPLGYFQTHSTSEIKDMMNEKVERLEEGIAHFIPEMTASTAVPFLTVVTMFLIDWRMGLAALLYVPVVYCSFKWVLRKLGIIGPELQKQQMRVMEAVLQYVYGMKVIKAFARADASYDSFRTVIEDSSQKMLALNLRIFRYKGLVVGLSRGGLLFVIPTGIWLYSTGTLGIPTFVFFVLMTLSFGKTIFDVIHSGSHAIDIVKRSMDSITAFLQEKSLPEPTEPLLPKGSEIRFHKVSFSYDEKRSVLKDLSFVAPEGKVTALVGTSGSGKSTIVRLVSRFWDVKNGAVSIGNVDVRQIASLELARNVSCVFQDVFLFNDTIMENIRIGKPNASDEEVMEAAKKASCHAFIMELPEGYQTQAGEHGSRLSGGQRQRISIARAILKDAPILLLDEATAYVDAENEARIQEALTALMHPKSGKPKTMIVVAHRLGTIADADQIVVIHDGEIEATGTHDELLQQQTRYAQMWTKFLATEQGIVNENKAEVFGIDHTQDVAVHTGSSTHSTLPATPNHPYTTLSEPNGYWRKLLQLAGPDRKQLLRACLFPLLAAPLISLTTWSVMAIIQALTVMDMTQAWGYAAILLFCLIGQVFLTIASFRGFERYDNAVGRRLRIYLGQHLRRLPMGFFLTKDAGTIQTRLTTDASGFGGLSIFDSIGTLIRGIVAPALLFGAMLWLDWRLSLFALLGIPAYLIMTRFINRMFDETMKQQNEAKSAANNQILEYIQGIPVIRSFASNHTRLERYEKAMAAYRDANMTVQNRMTPYQFWYSSLFEVGFAAVLLAGSVLYSIGSLSGMTFLLFMILMLGFFEPIPLLNYTLSRRLYLAAASRVSEVLDVPVLPEPEIAQEQKPVGVGIELHKVSFSYEGRKQGERTIINDLTLSIPAHSMTAFVGPSGGGKTTLLNLIARFWDVQAGHIRIGGVDVRDMRMDTLMSHLSIVFQDVYLFKDSVLNNIRFGRPEATEEEVIAAAKAARCHEFIVALPDGYNTRIGEGGSSLSGGEKQRISIARAILKDAPIVLLDEATSSIDPENEWEIQAALRALTVNKTLVVVAHRLSTIQHADQIVMINEGQIIQQGTHEQLLRVPGLYRQFCEERNRAQQWTLSNNTDANAMIGG